MTFQLNYDGMPYEFYIGYPPPKSTPKPSIYTGGKYNNCNASSYVCKNCKFSGVSTGCVNIAYDHIRATLLPTNPELFI